MPQSTTSQTKLNASMQQQSVIQQQLSLQPVTLQQQSDLQVSPEALSLVQKNAVHASTSNLQTEPLSFQQDVYASSQANSQSFSSTISDDLLSELENSADDLEFLSSSSWSDQTSHQFGSRCNQQKSAVPPPPPFLTPPKLQPVEKVMGDHPGNDVATLRELAIALACDAVFGRQELIKNRLSGRKNTGSLDRKKLDYIKTVVHTRRPTMSDVDFEQI